ncbi:thiamine-phosphate kinase [Psychromicrobium xiongbiense]|uniref:thiamine-phosphate kinase n=1 Tax=Psychromicrobium xiongbiense TaxID=3051184 RepID=UPI0025524A6A|nr:thiamine-phosphate kinase [Psychromicrobium sp. YIM S02556]
MSSPDPAPPGAEPIPAEQADTGLLVSELSEGELLARIFPRLANSAERSAVLLGPGDDAALVAAPDGRVLISTDTLVQNQDFRLLWNSGFRSTGFDVGWKAAAQNLSDMNAMGAEATALVVSLSLPGTIPVSWVEGVADGLVAGIERLGAQRCSVVGGDLSAASELSLTITVLGDLGGRAPVLRSGSRAGDVLAHCGNLGRASAGWALVEHPLNFRSWTEGQRSLVDLFARPVPPLSAGPAAAAAGATAMLDVSDGLLRDAQRLARASGVSLELFREALAELATPLEEIASLPEFNGLERILGGGEDYGLLATFPAGGALPDGFRVIGSVGSDDEEAGRVTLDGQPRVAMGWDHFAD